MQPGALRALEFDRIVEAVTRLRADADGRRAAGAARRRRPMPQKVAQLLAATTETVRFIADHGAVSAARVERPAADPRRARRRRARARSRCGCWRSPTFLDSVDETRAAHPPRAGLVSAARARPAPAPRRSRAKSRRRARRSTRRARSSTTRARSCGRSATGCASSARGCAARSSRTCAARTRRSTCRTRSSPSATAATCCVVKAEHRGGDSRASCTARRRAAPACSSSRSAPSRSTTTSSRSRSRKPRKSGASCWR